MHFQSASNMYNVKCSGPEDEDEEDEDETKKILDVSELGAEEAK